MNDFHYKRAKIQNQYTCHSHSDTDRVFLVIKDFMSIESRGGEIDLASNEIYVMPKGIGHNPYAKEE